MACNPGTEAGGPRACGVQAPGGLTCRCVGKVPASAGYWISAGSGQDSDATGWSPANQAPAKSLVGTPGRSIPVRSQGHPLWRSTVPPPPTELLEASCLATKRGLYRAAPGRPGCLRGPTTRTLSGRIGDMYASLRQAAAWYCKNAPRRSATGVPRTCRLIAGHCPPNRDLRQRNHIGTYRKTSVYRLNVVPLHLPPA